MQKVVKGIKARAARAKNVRVSIKKPKKASYFLETKKLYSGVDYFSKAEQNIILDI